MTAIALGLVTAVCWASAALASSRSVRYIDPTSVVAWVMAVGCVVSLPWALATGNPGVLHGSTLGWLIYAGIGNVVGLGAMYAALRVGKVGLVSPVTSTEGAIGAVFAAIAGEPLSGPVMALLAVIACGVVLAAIAPDPAPVDHEQPVRAVVYASIAALLFGGVLFGAGHISGGVPLAYLVVPARLAGTVLLAIPLALRGKLAFDRRALPFLITSGLAETIGFVTFSLGSRHSVAVTSVVASTFPAISAVAAFVLFKERLGKLQILAAIILVAATVALSAVV